MHPVSALCNLFHYLSLLRHLKAHNSCPEAGLRTMSLTEGQPR